MASTRKTAARRRTKFKFSELPWVKIATVVAILGVITVLVYRKFDIETVHEVAGRMNGGVAFALLVILPLLGFPASLLHVAAGIRFGVPLGLALVSLSILLQLFVSYALVHRWRAWFERARWVKKLQERIPKGAHASVSIFTLLLPGAPFAAVNYTLPLIGVPLRTFILCAWPLHTLRSTITVLLGGHSAHLTGTRLAVLIGYALLIVAASWWTYRRMQSQFSSPPRAVSGRKQPA